ncbi:MAG: phosphoribosylamine--glycine ligase, partial [Candidatus Hydrogenedentes bacterium]|nr:phosphoribosylamine--glycine ligase [Candidatus Hydrogenedentota bacterium]
LGDAATEWVIEEKLIGQEASFHALVDGVHALPLAAAQDHKALREDDLGPNTGGMGAYSPTPAVDDAMAAEIMSAIIEPTVAAMAAEGRPFKGVLYAGLMLTDDGPKVIEFNARFGDPETQVMVTRLMSDLLPALLAARDGTLDKIDLRWRDAASLCVVMASGGYPKAYEKGKTISGIPEAEGCENVTVFHAGTKQMDEGLRTNGGRVLNVTARGNDIESAIKRAYEAVEKIHFDGAHYRSDIGAKALDRIASTTKSD